MINFITDIQGDEPDMLGSVYREDLSIYSLGGEIITTISAPDIGWTHESLEAENVKIRELCTQGCDAYLGPAWVGSSEV